MIWLTVSELTEVPPPHVTLPALADVTVVAQLANNKQYTLAGATCKSNFEANARDGQVRVRWEGLWCEEINL